MSSSNIRQMIRRMCFTLKYHTSLKVFLFLRSLRYIRVHYRHVAAGFPESVKIDISTAGGPFRACKNKAMPDSQDTECVHVQYRGSFDDEEEDVRGEQKKINEPSDHVLK